MSILTPFQEKKMEKLSISQTVHAPTEKTCQAESVLEEKVSGACAVTCTGSESAAWETLLEMDNTSKARTTLIPVYLGSYSVMHKVGFRTKKVGLGKEELWLAFAVKRKIKTPQKDPNYAAFCYNLHSECYLGFQADMESTSHWQ